MCKTCYDTDNKVEISGIRQMADLVGGGEHLDIDETQWPPEIVKEFREGPEDSCLCPVDLGWTLLKAGFVVWVDRDYGEINFKRQVR